VTAQDEGEATEARIRAAAALRRLGHALVGRHCDDEILDRLAADTERAASELEAGEPRSRPVDAMKRRVYEQPPADGAGMDHFPDCIVSGQANPMGIAITVHRDGDDAVARVCFGPAFEGAPGRAHGGVVAAVFDDTLGFVLSMLQTPAFTGQLTVSYLAPTPVGEDLEFRARLRERNGRKLLIEGEARHEGQLVATCEGLFIAIPPERLGLPSG
jgi:acyl-coenzyme A thioesterase PaaI-like protein